LTDSSLRILITGACGVTPRAIARSLALSPRLPGSTLIGTDRGGNWYGFYEGLYDRVYLVPDADDPSYAALIADICRKEAIDVAVVSPEAEVLFWSRREFPVATLLPSERVVAVAISKRKLYDALRGTGLIPRYATVSRAELLEHRGLDLGEGPVWLRDFSDASSSGAGSIKVGSPGEAFAWAFLNPGIEQYLVAEYLPGRNFACCMVFDRGQLVKAGIYERLEYFMGHLVISGISGNIARGGLVNDERVRAIAEEAVRLISAQHDEPAHGLFTVDLRAAADGSPKVTEINVRHTAATSALAAGGANMAEAQVLTSLGRRGEAGETVVTLPEDSVILRDIDGPPLLVSERELEVGEFVERPGPN
jgi:predicted ATP-grasp superfamily ATP-dependent carboligase